MVGPLIQLQHVSKTYGGGEAPETTVLRDICLDVHHGEYVAIVGASGSGKSTLMNILGCLDRPTRGTYLFAGRDTAGHNSDELAQLRRAAFGFVFQHYHLIPTESALENVEVPAIYANRPEHERRKRATELLSLLGLADRLHHRPSQLSGGQQQRVSIARALSNGGNVILADEPTGALDTKSSAEVMALLDDLNAQGHTIILITHDRDVAEHAHRQIEIADGEIIRDTAAALSSMPERAPPAEDGVTGATDSQSNPATYAEAMRCAWRSMAANRIRTALTLLGIVIGVSSVIAMLAVGDGARQKVMNEMGKLGARIMYLGGDLPRTGGPRGRITLGDLEAIATLPDISHVIPAIGDPIIVRHGSVGERVYSLGSSPYLQEMHQWPVAMGRFHNERDDATLAPVVVLGETVRDRFFGPNVDPLGKQILLGKALFEVIGVMTEKGASSGNSDFDGQVYLPYRSALTRVYRREDPDYTMLEAVSAERVNAAETAVRELLIARHGVEDFHIGNAAARVQAELATRQSMTVMLALIAAISLIVGGIGVMNVMLMTVRERTREIGIRIAVGARHSDILRQFLTESVMLCLTGGASGVVLGGAIGLALHLGGIPVSLSASAAFGAFACALVTGLLFGYMPARRAARLDPVIALSSD